MSNLPIPSKDATFAEFFSLGTRILKWLPPLNWLIVGNNNVPNGWRHITESADIFEPWTSFLGVPESTKLPILRLYTKVGVLAVNKVEMNELHQENRGAHNAVALKFGQAVVVGALNKGVSFAEDVQNEGWLLVGTRIGRDEVRVKAGLYLPEESRFIGAESSQYRDRVPVTDLSLVIPTT